MLDISDIKVSTGSACNSKSIEPSYVLKSIGLTDDEAMKTIRISLSDDITYQDIDKVIDEIDKAIKLIET
jgi:cysteine desulfurase